MFSETAAPKIISVLIFWSFFILIMGFSFLSLLKENCPRYLGYARAYSRSNRRR